MRAHNSNTEASPQVEPKQNAEDSTTSTSNIESLTEEHKSDAIGTTDLGIEETEAISDLSPESEVPETDTPISNKLPKIDNGDNGANVVEPTTNDGSKNESSSKSISPIDRGGKVLGSKNENPMKPDRKPRQPKPEIVCWEKGRQWILGVEIPPEIYNNGNVTVFQDASPLQEDSRERCWRLPQAYGKIVVHSGEKIFKIDLGENGKNYLLFKIIGKNFREGGRVKSPSSGTYIVVVPDDWKATDNNSEALQVDAAGYQAYWQDFRNKTQEVAFGEKIIRSNASKFQLVGKNIFDVTEDSGLLFVENPPQIKSHGIDWNDVSVIIGEIGESKWRKEILLEDETDLQNLPAEVMEKQSGHYFLRFYDKNDERIESQAFRFVRGLKDLRVPRVLPFPDMDSQHDVAQVEIIHESDCMIEPANDSAKVTPIKQLEGKTILFIPPKPNYDKTIWRIGHKFGAKVELTVLLERVWWNMESENKEPSDWVSHPEMLSKDKFSATSNLALWIRFPAPRWTDKVSIGFQQEHKRDYPVSVSKQMICVRLSEFPITNPRLENILGIWVEHNGKQYEGKSIVVSRLCPSPDWVGRGRYKTANAMAMICKGTGQLEVNELSFTEYFQRTPADAIRYWQKMSEHEQIRDILLELDISIRIWGSNPDTKRTLKAVTHALAHALMQYKRNESDLVLILKRFRGVKVSQNEEGLHNESD